jgi:SAM-dependent methyltransferase
MNIAAKPRYQDYVIKDGVLVGDFEGLYKTFDDPWFQSMPVHSKDTRKRIVIDWLNRLKVNQGTVNVVELGCGFGHFTELLRKEGFLVVGVDISQTAIEKARIINPECNFIQAQFSNFSLLEKYQPDVFVLAEITWYVLDELDEFISNLKRYAQNKSKPTYLIHLLATYPVGVQKYGCDKFSNLEEIMQYFDLEFLEAGLIIAPTKEDLNAQGTYFIAKI